MCVPYIHLMESRPIIGIGTVCIEPVRPRSVYRLSSPVLVSELAGIGQGAGGIG